MKKSSLTRAASFALAFAMVCGSVVAVPVDADAANAKKITLSSAKKTMYVGQSFKLKVKKVTPAKASKAVTYKSDNTAVATVNKKGKVVAKSEGKATITVTSKKNKKAKAKCVVTVKKGVTNIQTAKKVYLQKGKKMTLNWTVAPTDAPNQKVAFKTSKKKIATVNKKGKITAKKTGKAKITVTSKGGNAKATVNVVIKKKITPVTGITLDKTTLDLNKGASAAVKATVAPANATAKEVYWLSSDQNVATVDANGNITAVADGTAIITAYATDSSKKTAAVTVNVTTPAAPVTPVDPVNPQPPVPDDVVDEIVEATGIDVTAGAKTIAIGKETTIQAMVAPVDATDKTIEWSIDGTSIVEGVSAVVSDDGASTLTIKGIAAGEATIIAKTGNVENSVKVTVVGSTVEVPPTVDVTDVSIDVIGRDDEEFSLYVGGSVRAYANVEPEDATNDQVVWNIDEGEGVVKVQQYKDMDTGEYFAEITGLKIGTAKVTVSSVDNPSKTDTVTVKVMGNAKKEIITSNDKETNVKFDTTKKHTVALNIGGREVIFDITPEDIQKAYDKYKAFAAIDNVETLWNKVTDDVADKAVEKLNSYLDKMGISKDVDATVSVVSKDEVTKTVTAEYNGYTVAADVVWDAKDKIIVNFADGEVLGDAKTVTISAIDLKDTDGDGKKSATISAGGYAADAAWSETEASAEYNDKPVATFEYDGTGELEAWVSVPEASEAYAKAKDTFEIPAGYEEYAQYVPATYEDMIDTFLNSDNVKIDKEN